MINPRDLPCKMIFSSSCRFTICMVYYALAMSAGSLGGNRYVSFSLSGLMDVPAAMVTYFIVDRYCDASRVAVAAVYTESEIRVSLTANNIYFCGNETEEEVLV